DLTRETVCETLGIPLEFHEESWRRIEEYFAAMEKECADSNRKQAMLPRGSIVFPNDHGTAPGCAVEKYGQRVVMLPGPPKELIPMFSDYVAPYLAQYAGGTIFSRTVGVFGLPESSLAERLADLMSESNPSVAPYADSGEVVLRITAHAADSAAARALCDPVVEEIRRRLGAFIYGVDAGSLQKATVALLREKELKIATAESCTAGLLSGRITEIPGASQVFECGIAAYSNEIKRDVLSVPEEMLETFGAVSAETACAMALGARRVGHAALGVGITGVAGPDASEGKPVGTVYIALADDKRTWVKKITAGHGPDDRETVRYIATSHALDLVRRYLEAMPAVMAGGEMVEEPPAAPPAAIPKSDTVRGRRFLSMLFPHRGDSKKTVLLKAGLWGVSFLLLAAAVLLLYTYVLSPARNRYLYDDLRQMYSQGTQPVSNTVYPDGMSSQFYSLYSLNDEIRGWVRIDGTKINYPVMQAEDDLYYWNHSFERKPTPYGTPYFNSTASLSSSTAVNRNLIIYGNNTDELLSVSDGQMFSELLRYTDEDMVFLKEHPVIEMNTVYRSADWKIFSVLLVSTSSQHPNNFDYARTHFTDDEDFLLFAEQLRERSLFTLPVEVRADDTLLMLSTNAEDYGGFEGARLVVAARQVRTDEAAESDLTTAERNATVVMPDIWREKHADGQRSTVRTTTATSSNGSPTATAAESDESADSTSSEEDPLTSSTSPAASDQTATTTERPTEPPAPPHTSTSSAPSSSAPTVPPPTRPPQTTDPDLQENDQEESKYLRYFRIQDRKNGQVLSPSTPAELQHALSLVVKMELPSASTMQYSMEAHKAQAVAAYTFVMHYVYSYGTPYPFTFPSLDLNNTVDRKIYDAVGEVLGVKLLDLSKPNIGSQVCTVQYFAYANGYTANNNDIYATNVAYPYLRAVTSPETPADITHYYGGTKSMENACTITWSALKSALSKAVGDAEIHTDAAPGEPPLRVVSTASGGYVTATSLYYYDKNGKVQYVSGNQIRNAAGANVLRSAAFTVAYNAGSDTLTFTSQGWGHGVGMSQIGAAIYANQHGWNYKQILSHYYSITGGTSYQLTAPCWGALANKLPSEDRTEAADQPQEAPALSAEPVRRRFDEI
ncbi:MAG: CinA family nicotinamide mononucleotide deamidase-related protein, partial [Clostridiales bacterium]|nr:CinA family nicotinamide mononucleotide deamidase-related protein [Clostridiales bacterium]